MDPLLYTVGAKTDSATGDRQQAVKSVASELRRWPQLYSRTEFIPFIRETGQNGMNSVRPVNYPALAKKGTVVLRFTHPIIDIAIVCSDFEESLHFYRDMLGLEVHLDLEIPAEVAKGASLAPDGFRHVRLKAGNTLIKLMEIADPPAPRSHQFQAGVRWLTFFIEDLKSTVDRLRERGVEFFTEPVSAPDAAYIVCAKAPDGILVELVQIEAD